MFPVVGASPVPAVIHGQRRVFVFAGGESEDPGDEDDFREEHQRMLIGSTSIATSTPLSFRESITDSTARRNPVRCGERNRI